MKKMGVVTFVAGFMIGVTLLSVWHKSAPILNKYGFLFFFIFFYLLGGIQIIREEKIEDNLLKISTRQVFVMEGQVEEVQANEFGSTILLSAVKIGDKHVTKTVYSLRKVYVYTKSNLPISLGNRIQLKGKFTPFPVSRNPGNFNLQEYYLSIGVDGSFQGVSLSVKDHHKNHIKILKKCITQELEKNADALYKEQHKAVIKSIILGNRQELESDTVKSYQETGIYHFLSISGAHIGCIGIFSYYLFRKIFLGRKMASILGLIVVFVYGFIIEPSISSDRAIIMFLIFFLAKILGRSYDLLTGSFFGIFITLVIHPLQLFQPGFLLSYGAVIGIGIYIEYKLFKRKEGGEKNVGKRSVWKKRFLKLKKWIIEYLTVSLILQGVMLPVLLFFFSEISCYGTITNLFLAPVSTPLILFGILSILLGKSFFGIGIFASKICEFLMDYIDFVTLKIQTLPGGMVLLGKPEMVKILLYVSGIALLTRIVFYKIPEKRRVFSRKDLCSMLLSIVLIASFFIPVQEKGLEIYFLDVGQGDGIFIREENGTTFFIDGGSSDVKKVGTYRILPFLKAKRISHIDYWILSHSDMDHCSGILELIEDGYPVNCLIISAPQKKEKGIEKIIENAREKSIEIISFHEKDSIEVGNLKLTCLWPNTESGFVEKNNLSLVIDLEYYDFNGIFTGDISSEQEEKIAGKTKKRYDLLKASHHGSRFGTSVKFLKKIHPDIAIISCGEDNLYGHPGKSTLQALENFSVKTYLTKDKGGILVKIKKGKLSLFPFLHD